jgi:MinD-like ATPase involved in chromosome partitioning or flagellar assembly
MGYDSDRIVLVLNRADSRVGIDDDDVLAVVGKRPDIRVPSDVEVPRAINEGTPIVLAKPDSAAAKAYRALANEFLRREGQETAPAKASQRRGSRRGAPELADSAASTDNGTAPEAAPDEHRKRLRLGSRRR